ncbi:hypothetical protein ON010_g17086 [Phytophthora cinnamomi]|nr:hypothetical protein ON010_g17086 [Phytophthora cinnamomi]
MVQPDVADVASAAAGAGKDPGSGGVEASAAPGRKWPRRGPGLSDVPRKSVAQASTEDVQVEEDGAETRGDSTQGESTGASTAGDTGDACGDAEESQHVSNALHGQGIGSRVEVAVDPPTTWHTSWEGWQAYLKTYCASTMQVLVVQETMKRDEQNKRLSKTKKGADVSKLIPEGLEPYSRMLAVGAKRSKIYDYLLEHDQNVIQVDVDNLVREHASSVATEDDNDATAREIAAFAATDPNNVSAVSETASGEKLA